MAGRPPGAGRKKGTPNKLTGQVKEMILAALDQAGGVGYLVMQSGENPTAFMALVGKVLPLQVTGDPAHPVAVSHTINLKAVYPKHDADS